MKKLILYIAASFISYAAYAQDNASDGAKPKSFFAVTGGMSNLMGNITKTDYHNNSSGYAAAMGYNTGIEGAYFLNKYLGVGGVFSFASFNVTGLQTMSDGFKHDFGVDSIAVTVTTKYNFFNYLVGPYFAYPYKKFTFDARVVAGFVYVTTPEFDIFVEDGGKPHPCAQNISSAGAFGFQAGLGVRYSITNRIGLKLGADYYSTNPNITIQNSNRPIAGARLLTNYHEPISMMNINLGLIYQFGN
ncbi:MAG TPA: outer membrane beta-barrel protein [Bacteroidia bacterium]|jgi:hypothetical protein|nr:outer membrane beta-barrel protein [Bacteroidia bacterium]